MSSVAGSVVLAGLLCAGGDSTSRPRSFTFHHDHLLGTSLDLTVVASYPEEARAVETVVLREVERLRRSLTGYEQDGQLWKLNRTRNWVRASPELIAVARLASLRARGVVATARPWDSWLFDGISEPSNIRPWLVVTPDDLTIEIVFDEHAFLDAARRVLLRLLADRWTVVVRVHPNGVPQAVQELGDLPIHIRPWDRM